ncbi:L,D-transpeptidase family protein [Luteolibacter pohnpeiensis]|uniref:L,D-transpeptidase family protein n=1 Tax=Luteolibacter pohnpeiensis TaxID=454153 RepID=A0A934S8L4_9BACT|nr:L,D-transpeptidase family protein [Luteolibacter pohnpeiensis]MBK1883244.1 L,D-transpeptidase family protein [Luteolibacter pohnpeiensis]
MIPTISIIARIAGLAASVVLVSCGPLGSPSNPPRAQQVMYEWHDDGGPGEVSVDISLSEQIARFNRGGQEIGWTYVTTGKEGHATTPGSYQITEKIVDKHSNRYGWMENAAGEVIDGDARYDDPVPAGARYVPAPMPYWMRLTNYGVGMHGGIIPKPGQPSSHGCIRLPHDFVPKAFDAVKVGTPVKISA